MKRTLTVSELRDRLVRSGHTVPDAMEETAGIADAWPPPDTIVTVGLHLDPTLKPLYRERYFVCLLESEQNPVPVLQYEEEFQVVDPFRRAAAEQPPAGSFMAGPFRWLLQRLRGFPQVLLWPASRGHESGSPGFGQLGLLEGLFRLQEWLQAVKSSPSRVGAVVLNLVEARDCAVLWEVANNVSESFHDFFVSDLECEEVYILHHHEKVVASVPGYVTREKMLQELSDWDNVLEDCSGYLSEMDQENE